MHAGDLLQDGRYKLWNVIGSGGFATVWRAYDRKRQQPVAIKLLHGQYAQDRSRRERFFRGAKRMASLQHSGIVKVLDEEQVDDGHYFFVMEYVDGQDLHRALRDGHVGPEQGRELVLQVGEALAYAHEQGMIHRDVKPANILLDAQGRPKLTDFDLVRAQDTTGGTRTGAIGTFVYAAPEQLENAKNVDERADVYGLGMTLVALLHGKPLPATVMRNLGKLIDALDCAKHLRRVLHRAVDWELDQRYESVGEFLQALKPAPPRPDPPPPPIQVEPVAAEPEVPRGSSIVRLAADQPAAGTLWEGPLGMRFRYVPAGVYVVGSPEDEPGRFGWEWLPHEVELTRGVWMAETPVTQAQWGQLVPDNPSRFSDNRWEHPVERVNWYEAVAFANRLSVEAGLEPCYSLNGQKGDLGKDFKCVSAELLLPLRSGFRLPTEAEWEIAARAGTAGARYAENLDDIAWYRENSGQRTHSVGRRQPNAWGLHDLLGNVREWVGDRFSGDQPATPRVDPQGPEDGPARVCRGGSWGAHARYVRAAYRDGDQPGYRYGSLGFRLSRGPQPGGAEPR